MSEKTSSRIAALLLLTAVAGAGEAADWRYSVGIHDFMVADADSHTYGLDASASIDERTAAGRHWLGSFDLFLDRDKDDLDPDHIPIWWQIHLGTDGDFWRAGALPACRLERGHQHPDEHGQLRGAADHRAAEARRRI